MTRGQQYNYEEYMMNLDEVLNLIDQSIQNHKPLSLARFGHLELAYLGWTYFPEWTNSMEPFSSYSGANASIARIRDDLTAALKTVDIVGFHASWGAAWEDRKTAQLTAELLRHINFRPKHVCSAFVTHEIVKSDSFWACLKDRKVALVGRRAAEARPLFLNRGINVTYTSNFEGYADLEKVYQELICRQDWDIALVAAGIAAKVLAPRLANQARRVVIDFGHALDKLIDGADFDYQRLLKDWKAGLDKNMLISIVMAVYNGEKFLTEALGSILSQSYTNLELVIVNDGSTDSTKTILDKIEDERVRVIHFERNQGAANALNTAIREAKGTWIAIHDADDNSYPSRIEEQVKYINEHSHLVGVGTLAECIAGDSKISDNSLKKVEQNKNCDISRTQIRQKSYYGCPLFHSSVMFSKDIFWEVGGYNQEFKIAYDYDLWLRLLERGEMEKVPEVLLQYRVYDSSLSNKDPIATVNEIQIVSSQAIYRLLKQNKQSQPTVMVIGPKKACKNYRALIYPSSGLQVQTYIYEDFKKQVHRSVRKFKEGKVHAIIVLDFKKSDKIIGYLEEKGLELNQHIFKLYNCW